MRIDIDPRLEIDDELARQLQQNRLPPSPRGRTRSARRRAPVTWWRLRRGRGGRSRPQLERWIVRLMAVTLLWMIFQALIGV